MATQVVVKINPYPAPGQAAVLNAQYGGGNIAKSVETTTCKGCQEGGLSWSWNFAAKKPILIKDGYVHNCPTPQTHDVFPGWCEKCKAADLLWIRKSYGFELTEDYGLPHACEQDPMKAIQDMSKASCKYCKTTGLFWVKVNAKYTLTHPDGAKHTCSYFTPYMNDWAEGLRMNYAIEKKWLKAIPDGTPCKKCKGEGHTSFLSKNKRTMAKYGSSEPILMHRPCMKCKRIGTYTVEKKKEYLKNLRMRYWPFKGGKHKWKQYDGQ